MKAIPIKVGHDAIEKNYADGKDIGPSLHSLGMEGVNLVDGAPQKAVAPVLYVVPGERKATAM